MFVSKEALCQEFALDSSKASDTLIEELARRRASIHPDKTGGAFLSQAAESQYQRLSEAIEFLRDSRTQLALQPTPELLHLTNLITSLQSTIDQLKLDRTQSDQLESAVKKKLSRSYLPFRIASATFATVCATILSFADKLQKNPMLAPLASSHIAKWSIVAIFALSGVAFLISWVNEKRLKALMDFLVSDSGLHAVLYWCLRPGKNETPKTEVTKEQIIQEIIEIGDPWHKSKMVRSLKRLTKIRVPNEFADEVAFLQLSILTDRGVLTREGLKGIAPRFVIDPDRVDEILENFHGPYSPRFW